MSLSFGKMNLAVHVHLELFFGTSGSGALVVLPQTRRFTLTKGQPSKIQTRTKRQYKETQRMLKFQGLDTGLESQHGP